MEKERKRQKSHVPIWRSAEGRAWIFQLCMVALLVWVAVTMYHNTLINLETRGIGSGFSFLKNEAGFRIGEITAIPLPKGGVLYFLISLAVGLFFSRKLARYGKREQGYLGSGMVWAIIICSLLLPLLVLYLFHDSIEFIRYSEASSYSMALLTGLANTLKVTVICCVASTILGLLVALGRLSPNWLLSTLCRWYVELNRNLPVLLQLFFWYFIVFQQLPNVRQSIDIGGWLILNKRGLSLPGFLPTESVWIFVFAFFFLLITLFLLLRRRAISRNSSGEATAVWFPFITLCLLILTLLYAFLGAPFHLEFPQLKGFNYRGGVTLTPEFATLVTGLTVYVSAFNAEIIRAGIESVPKGQREAARALAMGEGEMMRVVILPQALRVILPPMTSEYLAVAKNSSLAVAIGYPEFVSVGGTILNQSGQSIEIVGIWMGVYLCISLLISTAMNIYNSRITLGGR